MSDGLPENTNYKDKGCDIHKECLSCPLPQCRYEMAPNQARLHILLTRINTQELYRLTDQRLADELGVAKRTAGRLKVKSRLLREARDSLHDAG